MKNIISIKEELKNSTKTYSEKLKDPHWQKKRLEILQRDNFTCRFCGDDKSTLNVHHISYNENPWDTDNSLLITLCESCHEIETLDFKESINDLTKALKENGFVSNSIRGLIKIVKAKNRGWTFFEPLFDIIAHGIENDKLFDLIDESFWSEIIKK